MQSTIGSWRVIMMFRAVAVHSGVLVYMGLWIVC